MKGLVCREDESQSRFSCGVGKFWGGAWSSWFKMVRWPPPSSIEHAYDREMNECKNCTRVTHVDARLSEGSGGEERSDGDGVTHFEAFVVAVSLLFTWCCRRRR